VFGIIGKERDGNNLQLLYSAHVNRSCKDERLTGIRSANQQVLFGEQRSYFNRILCILQIASIHHHVVMHIN
jgi:hypothetical protein